MIRWVVLVIVGVGVLAPLGCRSGVEEIHMEGVNLDSEGVFRQLDIPSVATDEAHRMLVQLFSESLGRRGITANVEDLTVEAIRSFTETDRRVHLYGHVTPIDGGTRLELLARLEEIRSDVESHQSEPWVASDPWRDWKLENHFFAAMWEELVIAKELDRAP